VSDDATSFTLELQDHMTGPANDASSALGGMGSVLTSVAGIALAAAAAFVGLVYAMASISIQAREQQDNQLALAESMTGSADAARELVDAQYKIAQGSALAQDSTLELGNRLLDAGVSAKIYSDTLKALADTSVIAGEKALKPIEKIIKTVEQTGKFQLSDAALKGSGIKVADVIQQLANDTGKSVEQIKQQMKSGQIAAEDGLSAMNKVLEAKFGKQAAGQLTDFSVQVQKFKDNITDIFKDVDTAPFLNALHELLSIFDSSTTTGAAMKSTLVGAMNGFFQAAAWAIPHVEAFLLGIGIAALDVYISMKPLIGQIKQLLGSKEHGTEDSLKAASIAGKIFGTVIGSQVHLAAFAIRNMVAIIKGIGNAFNWARAKAHSVWTSIQLAFGLVNNYLGGMPVRFLTLASNMIAGLVNGIKAGAGAVLGAITGVVEGGINGAKALLHISSPSKVFHEIGANTAAGMAGGVKSGAQQVHAAVKHMVSIPSDPANDNGRQRRRELGKREASSSSSGGGRQVTIQSGAVVINIHPREGQDAKDIAREVRREFLSMVEELAS
jgi:hypothetical protein